MWAYILRKPTVLAASAPAQLSVIERRRSTLVSTTNRPQIIAFSQLLHRLVYPLERLFLHQNNKATPGLHDIIIM